MNKREKLAAERGAGVARAYQSWVMLRMRVRHPLRNKRNGAGYQHLTVDESWNDFEKFLVDMGERPDGLSIDRIDNSKGYSPDNCRWASATTQSRNRTYARLCESDAAEIRAAYESGCISQQAIADKYGVSQRTVSMVVRGQTWGVNHA